MTSVRAGLSALSLPCDGVMVCLADQPALAPEDLASIRAAFVAGGDGERGSEARVLVPTFRGARGNPIVLSDAEAREILARGGNFGCRQLVANNADLVTALEMPNDHVLRDVDVPEDYARRERT